MTISVTLRPHYATLGDTTEVATGELVLSANEPTIQLSEHVFVTVPTSTLDLSENWPTIETSEAYQEIIRIHGGGGHWFAPIRLHQETIVQLGKAKLKLKANKPQILVSENIRCCVEFTLTELSTLKPFVVIEYDKERAEEERQLTELLAAIL